LSAGALPQTPLGELTALPQIPSWFRGWDHAGKGEEGGEGKGRGRERRGREGKLDPQIFRWTDAFG